MTEKRARELKSVFTKAMQTVDDESALKAPQYFDEWDIDVEYKKDKRVQRNGELYKCLQSNTSQGDWPPEDASSLWAKVLPGQDGTDIGEWVQPDSTNGYSRGNRVIHNGQIWESDCNNNVWEPGVYGWHVVE